MNGGDVMSNKIKRFLLCFLAVSAMSMGGNIFAVDGNDDEGVSSVDEESEEEAGESGSETRAKRSEAVEKTDFDAETAKKFFINAGNADGLDVYIKSKDYEDEIWASHGGKPDKKAELTEAQEKEKEAAEDEISAVKKLGDAVAFYSETGEPAAEFKELADKDGIRSFISSEGRFIIEAQSDTNKIIKVKNIVSTLDSENVFLSDDGKTLELMSDDNKKVDTVFRYASTADRMMTYKSESDDKFAWVSQEADHFYGIYRYGAENDNFRMIVDDAHAIFGLENKKTGYIWWSSPFDATQDTYATPLLVDGLRSSNMMNYGIIESRNTSNTLYSNTSDCVVTVSDIANGIRVVYDYKKAGFKFPVEYTLESDHLKASLKVGEIEETNSANAALEMTVLANFGAASDKEDGYFIIPDGSGALVRFNNDKVMGSNAYMQKVYGSDITAVPTTKGAVTEQIYLPVYGIVKEDNAMLVVASKGDSNASVSVKVSKQSNTSYNMCNFTFTLRNTDTYFMSGGNQKLTMFESGKIKSDDIELLYYPIAKEGVDYVDVAECYRNYLVNEAGVTKKAEAGYAPMYVDLYGGVQKKKPILGIPVTLKTAVTDYEQAKEILTGLNGSGVDKMVVSYNNWTNDGIKNKIDTDAKPSGTLGGKKDFNSLVDYMNGNDIEFYPVSDNRNFYSGNGYYSFTSTAVRVSGNYSRIVSYDRAYGIPDGFKKNMSLLSPSYFGEIMGDISENYPKSGLEGVSVADLTTALYGDYGKKAMSRCDTMKQLVESYKKLDSSLENGMLADSANAYALPYVSHITNVPLSSSRFDMFDEDIPFYQLVMHGIIPYSTTAVNGSADSETLLLMAAATGSNLSYDMLYEETSLLKDTEFDIYYYANYQNWIETAAAEYRLIEPILSSVSDAVITGYVTENDGNNITTTYSNGNVISVDFEEKSIDFNGSRYYLSDLEEEGGIRF